MIEGIIIGILIGFGLTSLFAYLIYLKFVKKPMNKLINESFSGFLDFGLKNSINIPKTIKSVSDLNKKFDFFVILALFSTSSFW